LRISSLLVEDGAQHLHLSQFTVGVIVPVELALDGVGEIYQFHGDRSLRNPVVLPRAVSEAATPQRHSRSIISNDQQ
jgi:hypothetical protein